MGIPWETDRMVYIYIYIYGSVWGPRGIVLQGGLDKAYKSVLLDL